MQMDTLETLSLKMGNDDPEELDFIKRVNALLSPEHEHEFEPDSEYEAEPTPTTGGETPYQESMVGTPYTPYSEAESTPQHHHHQQEDYSEVELDNSENHSLEHLILVMESKIMRKFAELETKLNSFSLKQMKRKRTGYNRCKALNRKGEVCNGYVCKNKSKHLCYAHYVLIDKKKENASYLYCKK